MIYDQTKTLKEHEIAILSEALKHHRRIVPMAKALGVSRGVCYALIRKHKLKLFKRTGPRLFTELTTEDVQLLWASCKFNVRKMERRLKCSRPTVYGLLRLHGIKTSQSILKLEKLNSSQRRANKPQLPCGVNIINKGAA